MRIRRFVGGLATATLLFVSGCSSVTAKPPEPTAITSVTPGIVPGSSSPKVGLPPRASTTAVQSPGLLACLRQNTKPQIAFAPGKMAIPALKLELAVIALPLVRPAKLPSVPLHNPAIDPLRSAAWFKSSPQPGSAAGSTYMSVHTYTPEATPAPGNVIGGKIGRGIKLGDVVWVYDKSSTLRGCYVIDTIEEPLAANTPVPSRYLSYDGAPRLTIVFCWDSSPTAWGTWSQQRAVSGSLAG